MGDEPNDRSVVTEEVAALSPKPSPERKPALRRSPWRWSPGVLVRNSCLLAFPREEGADPRHPGPGP